ncbi:MAG: SMP-30/gluconolactonase/LRE family protein, partial [Anaerolineales bacterium]
MSYHAAHFYPAGNNLGEGPRWHPGENALYWVDIEKGEIHTLELDELKHDVHNVETSVGCLAFRDVSGLVLATGKGFLYWSGNEGITRIIDPRMESGEGRFNDGAVDPQGRFWAGTMTLEGSDNCLYRLDPDGSVERMETGIAISNGIGWSPDGAIFYFTDSPKKTIYAYDYDPSEGKIFNRRVWVHTPDEAGVPDGL